MDGAGLHIDDHKDGMVRMYRGRGQQHRGEQMMRRWRVTVQATNMGEQQHWQTCNMHLVEVMSNAQDMRDDKSEWTNTTMKNHGCSVLRCVCKGRGLTWASGGVERRRRGHAHGRWQLLPRRRFWQRIDLPPPELYQYSSYTWYACYQTSLIPSEKNKAKQNTMSVAGRRVAEVWSPATNTETTNTKQRQWIRSKYKWNKVCVVRNVTETRDNGETVKEGSKIIEDKK